MIKEEFFRDLSFCIARYFSELYPNKNEKWKLQRATYIVAKIFDEIEKSPKKRQNKTSGITTGS